MNPVSIVLAHGKEQATFNRHFGLWISLNVPICVMSPQDDPIKHIAHSSFVYGQSAHHGVEYGRRVIAALNWFVSSEFDTSIWFDYDSFCLGKLPECGDSILCNVGINGEPYRFTAETYPCMPMMMSKATAIKLLVYANEPDEDEGYADRMFGAWAFWANIPIVGFSPEGFCRNTIGPTDYRDLAEKILLGGTMIHGVKDKETLEFVLRNSHPR